MTIIMLKWIFLAEGLLFTALGFPLALGWIPQNLVYGFRTAKTLSDPKIWFEANHRMGLDLIVAGAVIATAALILPNLLRTRSVAIIALANVAFDATILILVTIRGLMKLRGLG
jgi:hypothetical protein